MAPRHSGACQGHQTQASSWDVPVGAERRPAEPFGAALRSLGLGLRQTGAPSDRASVWKQQEQIASCPLLGNLACCVSSECYRGPGGTIGAEIPQSARIPPAGQGPRPSHFPGDTRRKAECGYQGSLPSSLSSVRSPSAE